MKVIIVGCTHAGTAAAINAAKSCTNAEITVYEKNDNISFLSCGIALYIEGIVKDSKGLFYSSPDKLKALGISAKMKHEVLSVDTKKREILVKNIETNEEFTDSYDKLIVATGSWPICPTLEGSNLKNILLCKNYNHALEIIEKNKTAKNVAVVGAGYIGVELAEAFKEQGKNVVLIDTEERIINKYMDKEFTDKGEDEFRKHGIVLALNEKVVKFEGTNNNVSTVITDTNKYAADMVVLCIGFKPNTLLFKDKLEMLPNGAIVVDEYMQTSDPNIFAAGDCCAVFYNPEMKTKYIPLATNAIRMGTIAGRNLANKTVKHIGTQGSSGIKIYDMHMAATGLTEASAKQLYKNIKTVSITENYRPEFMPTYTEVLLKLVYNADNGEVLGAQLASTADYTQTINTISVCIYKKMTIQELAFVDQFFQPHFNKPWNIINSIALNAL